MNNALAFIGEVVATGVKGFFLKTESHQAAAFSFGAAIKA
jgi:hypothetical protein